MSRLSSKFVSGLFRVTLAVAFLAGGAFIWSGGGGSLHAAAPAEAAPGKAAEAGPDGKVKTKKKTKKKSTKSKTGKTKKGKTKAKGPAPSFSTTKKRADGVDTPLAAVSIWQEYIDSDPDDPKELEKAKAEMAKWQELADGGAEKIKGKWVGGEERKKIVEKATALSDEGYELFQKDQTLQALKKLEESAAIYPNSFDTNFLLGFLNALQDKDKESAKYFTEALRVRPGSPEALSNIGVLHARKKKYAEAITSTYKAVEGFDHPAIAQNLVAAIAVAPKSMRKNNRNKQAVEAAKLLAAKYNLDENSTQFFFVPPLPRADGQAGGGEQPPPGMSSGTGFVINDDGLILTNRHVVDGGKSYMVFLTIDGKQEQRSAEVVNIDDEQDLALIRVKLDEGQKLPILYLSAADSPNEGAECTVMGFPLMDRLGASVKVTRGIVSSGSGDLAGADVMVDCTVNPGNSGGPILDKYGNVMAIVCMKSLTTAMEDSYGLGISAGRIRKFLTKNNVTVTPGEEGFGSLSTEEIASKAKPGAVCILTTH